MALSGRAALGAGIGSADRGSAQALHDRVPCAAERRLAAFTAASEEIVWELDRSGTITYVSAAVARHLGYEPIELLGQSWQAITPSSEHERGSALIEGSASAGARWDDEEFVFTTRNGDLRPLWSTGLAQVDRHGVVVGFAGTLRPVHGGGAARDERLLELINDIVARRLIRPVFQPIVDLRRGRPVAVEALARFPFHPGATPAQLFANAVTLGLAAELELAAAERALGQAQFLPARVSVSVNISPQTLVGDRLAELIAASGRPPSRLILEITEQVPVIEYDPIVAAMTSLRERGCRLAVDDAGAGYASFRHILALAPDLIKLDRFLVTDVDTDPARRALIRSVVGFAADVGAEIVGEGIESAGQAATLRDLGVRYGQGYFLGPPRPASDLGDLRG